MLENVKVGDKVKIRDGSIYRVTAIMKYHELPIKGIDMNYPILRLSWKSNGKWTEAFESEYDVVEVITC